MSEKYYTWRETHCTPENGATGGFVQSDIGERYEKLQAENERLRAENERLKKEMKPTVAELIAKIPPHMMIHREI